MADDERKWDAVPMAQGAYLTLTGIWPLVWMDGFLSVTGPKEELWLVRTVALLALVIGVTLLAAAVRGRHMGETAWLGLGTALAFFLVDVVGYGANAVGAVYLLDALAQGVFVAGWAWLIYATPVGEPA